MVGLQDAPGKHQHELCCSSETLKATANILDTVLNKFLNLQMLKGAVLLLFSKMQSQFISKYKMYLYVQY